MQELFLPISLTMGVVGWGALTLWFGLPTLDQISRRDHFAALIIPHVFRYIGLGFLVTGVTAGALDPRFSEPAAWAISPPCSWRFWRSWRCDETGRLLRPWSGSSMLSAQWICCKP